MYVFGAIDFTHAMVDVGKFLGFSVTVCDARAAFATPARFPNADHLAVRWPDELLRDAPVDERTALIVLTHDEKFDIPLLQAALQSRAGYIGVMGSRKTHARRIEQLKAAGVTDEQLARLSAPVGLDIGARTPQETAISIAAELIACKHGRSGGRLSMADGPIRGLR
jgi:xanthine dehydrogenase accessory factor